MIPAVLASLVGGVTNAWPLLLKAPGRSRPARVGLPTRAGQRTNFSRPALTELHGKTGAQGRHIASA